MLIASIMLWGLHTTFCRLLSDDVEVHASGLFFCFSKVLSGVGNTEPFTRLEANKPCASAKTKATAKARGSSMCAEACEKHRDVLESPGVHQRKSILRRHGLTLP